MTRILVDERLASQLRSVKDSVELCDPTGRLFGHFVPVKKSEIVCPFTEEEILTAERQTGGRPLVDILANLEKE